MQASKNFIFQLLKYSAVTILCAFVSSCAEKTPEQIAKENLRQSELAVRRARVFMFENNALKAVELLEQTNNTYGANPDVCEALANAYVQQNQLSNAAIFFERAADLRGGDADLLVNAAKAYEQSGSTESAVKAYEKYLKLRPQDVVIWKTIAAAYEKLQHYESAMNAYMSALKVSGRNPTSTEAAQIGSLFLKLGNVQQARRWLEAAYAATAATNIETRKLIQLNMLAIYLAEKDMVKLESSMDELDKIDKEIVDKTYPQLRAQLADFKKKLQEAKDALDAEKQKEAAAKAEAEKKAAEQKAAEEAAAAAAKKAEEEKIAKETEEKAKSEQEAKEKLDGSSTETLKDEKPVPEKEVYINHVQKSQEALKNGDPKAAEQSAHRAVAADVQSPDAWTALAKAYEAEGKDNDAFLASGEALARMPEDIGANIYYLRTAAKVQTNEQFLNSLYAARKKFPYNSEILIGTARTYKVIGDHRNAKYFYQIFLRDTPKMHPLYEEVEKEYNEYISGK